MRFLVSILLLCLSTALPASVISEDEASCRPGDPASDAIADEFCRTSGPNADCANAVAWLARGALMVGQREHARLYADIKRLKPARHIDEILR